MLKSKFSTALSYVQMIGGRMWHDYSDNTFSSVLMFLRLFLPEKTAFSPVNVLTKRIWSKNWMYMKRSVRICKYFTNTAEDSSKIKWSNAGYISLQQNSPSELPSWISFLQCTSSTQPESWQGSYNSTCTDLPSSSYELWQVKMNGGKESCWDEH